MAGLTRRISYYVTVVLVVCARLASSRPRASTPGERRDIDYVSRQGRKALQSSGEWEIFQVLDFGGFYQAAVQAGDSEKNIHIIVQNHITAQGRGLDVVVRGRLRVTGLCTAKIAATENHITLEDEFDQDVDSLCQFYLNELSGSRGSLDPYQSRSNMAGVSFFSVGSTGYLHLQDVELVGCYSITGGACINVMGGEVLAERVGFAASLSTASGGAVWASLSPTGKSPTLNLTYPAFWETRAVNGANEVFFRGNPRNLVVTPTVIDMMDWIIIPTDTTPPPPVIDPTSPPTPPPPPPIPPSPPPPPAPGNYLPYDAPPEAPSSSWFEENKSLLIAVAASTVGAMMFCCVSCYLLNSHLKKNAVSDGPGHTDLQDASSRHKKRAPKDLRVAMEEGNGVFRGAESSGHNLPGISTDINERMSFHRGTGTSRHTLGHLDRKQARAEKLKDNIMSRSTRLLASKAQEAAPRTSVRGYQVAPDYRQAASRHGAASGPMTQHLLQPPSMKPQRQVGPHAMLLAPALRSESLQQLPPIESISIDDLDPATRKTKASRDKHNPTSSAWLSTADGVLPSSLEPVPGDRALQAVSSASAVGISIDAVKEF